MSASMVGRFAHTSAKVSASVRLGVLLACFGGMVLAQDAVTVIQGRVTADGAKQVRMRAAGQVLTAANLERNGRFQLTLPAPSGSRAAQELLQILGLVDACATRTAGPLPRVNVVTGYLEVLAESDAAPLGHLEFSRRGQRDTYLEIGVLTYSAQPSTTKANLRCASDDSRDVSVNLNLKPGWNIVTLSQNEEDSKIKVQAVPLNKTALSFVPVHN